MSDKSVCDECGCATDNFESCVGCGITICGDCAEHRVLDDGTVEWRCAACSGNYDPEDDERSDK